MNLKLIEELEECVGKRAKLHHHCGLDDTRNPARCSGPRKVERLSQELSAQRVRQKKRSHTHVRLRLDEPFYRKSRPSVKRIYVKSRIRARSLGLES